MNKLACAIALAGIVLAAGCAGSSTKSLPPFIAAHNSAGSTTLSGVVHGRFTEYAVPGHPVDFTKGPYNTLWFANNTTANFGSGFDLYRFAELTGAVSTFPKGAPWSVITAPLTFTGGRIYFISLNTAGPGESPQYLSSANSSGTISAGPQVASDEEIGRLAIGSDGKLWFPDCVQSCTEFPGAVRSITTAGASGADLPLGNFDANQLVAGPGGFMYASAVYTISLPPPTPPLDSAVLVLSTAGFGSIVHTYALPHGSDPFGIVVGYDKNLWIAEPGINKIARMTPSGTIAQFAIPTANAGAAWMASGFDQSVWFTETNANKIGRITTSGSITEFTIPTANSKPNGINYCGGTPATLCAPYGGVWFVETGASKIGKFISPFPT